MKNFLTSIALLLLSTSLLAQSSNKVSTLNQTQGANFGEKINEGATAVKGGPIGGIVVKGGRIGSVNGISVVTNAAGEFSFTVSEAGDYSLSLQSGENPLFQESGQSGVNVLHRAAPGNPIGGIIVKGGKNPGGNFLTLKTNDQGILELRGLTPGSYTFNIEQKFTKTTSGLKDTLKTQV
ncbi:MAG: hypothetical protein EOO92_24445 [Pedobacter sp.]|nr:MAG: hypothetical protein EOO92_24445 [Pedobacter sp.]